MTAPGTIQSNAFTADCSRQANQVSLRVSGRLVDMRHKMPDWTACLQRLAGADVRIDLGSVTEIDARGLGMLAELTRETRQGGGRSSWSTPTRGSSASCGSPTSTASSKRATGGQRRESGT